MKITGRALERIDLMRTRLAKPMRLHITPRTCVYLWVEPAAPGDHESTCRIERGL